MDPVDQASLDVDLDLNIAVGVDLDLDGNVGVNLDTSIIFKHITSNEPQRRGKQEQEQ